jgi:hypothetical protein
MSEASKNFGFLNSLAEIAAWADRSERTVERWIKAGMPHTRAGSRIVSHELLVSSWRSYEHDRAGQADAE